MQGGKISHRGEQAAVHDLGQQAQARVGVHGVCLPDEGLLCLLLGVPGPGQAGELGGDDQATRVPRGEGCAFGDVEATPPRGCLACTSMAC